MLFPSTALEAWRTGVETSSKEPALEVYLEFDVQITITRMDLSGIDLDKAVNLCHRLISSYSCTIEV